MSKYRVYSGPYFPVFGLNNSAFGHFSRSDNHEKKVYVEFDNNISKAVTKNIEIRGIVKEIVPIRV